jgi:predicted PurR-regulated permease PerM
VLAAFMLVIGSIAIGATLIAPAVSDEAQLLSEQLPQLAERANLANNPLPSWLEAFRGRLNGFAQENLKTAMLAAMPFARSVGTEILLFVGNLFFVVLIPILAFFFVKDGLQIRDALLLWLNPIAPRGNPSRIVSDLDDALGNYVRALGLLSLATLIAYGIVFSAAGVPYAIFLAAIAALLEILPLLGPLTAALIALSVAGLSGYDHLVWIAGFILCYRIFQDYVLYPYLMGDRSHIHPVMIIFGLLAGEQLGGVAGVFLSVPVVVAVVIVARHRRDSDAKSTRASASE